MCCEGLGRASSVQACGKGLVTAVPGERSLLQKGFQVWSGFIVLRNSLQQWLALCWYDVLWPFPKKLLWNKGRAAPPTINGDLFLSKSISCLYNTLHTKLYCLFLQVAVVM